ncbi:MAG TPA: polyphosphate kinase 2 family protein [Thermoplasmata archaeon]|nr:MAG TPA: polyphosphate kinase 2 family protein [Thermoplasmata archaeon]
MIKEKYLKKLIVAPGKKVKLKDFPTGWAQNEEFKSLGKDALKEQASELLEANRNTLAQAQELLWASNIYSVLIVLQGMDTSGKDGTIKHVMSGVNPQGCRVTSFKEPTPEETDHNFLWRYTRALPSRGEIGIFNRSYYEDVLVVKVHPEILNKQQLPPGRRGDKFWNARYDDINAYERHLVKNGTLILKFFLNISKEEQKRRLMERLENKEKYWKFALSDLAERRYWDDYQEAYEIMFFKTSTDEAPWYILPADFKWVARTAVADIVSTKIQALDLQFPKVSEESLKNLEKARKELKNE